MSEMSIAELARLVDRIEKRQDGYVSTEVYERDLKELRNDIGEIKESQKWMMRLMVSQLFGLIVAVVMFVVTQGI